MGSTVVVTGSNGFIGSIVVHDLIQKGHKVIGVSKGGNRLPESKNLVFYSSDITNESHVAQIFENERPSYVIHCAAISQVDLCEKDSERCEQVNVYGTKILLGQAKKFQSHFVFLSSDFVFDGKSPWVTEKTVPYPISVYGKSKLEGEKLVMESQLKWTIIRPVLVYGFSPYCQRSNIFTWIIHDLQKEKSVYLADDQIRTPTYVGDVSKFISWVVERGSQGMYNLGGPTQISVWEFGKIVANFIGVSESLVSAKSSLLIPNAYLRPVHSCFDCKPIEYMVGSPFHSVENGVQLAFHQWKSAKHR